MVAPAAQVVDNLAQEGAQEDVAGARAHHAQDVAGAPAHWCHKEEAQDGQDEVQGPVVDQEKAAVN